MDVLAQITKVHAVSDVGTATDLLPTRSIEVQSTGRNDVATMPDRSHLVPGSTMANMQQLLQFLNNTVPVMEQEMASQTHMQPQAYRAAYGTEVSQAWPSPSARAIHELCTSWVLTQDF